MDYLTRYYKNLSEDLQRKLNLLEYVLPGVNPYSGRRTPTTGLLDFPQTRTLTGEERPSSAQQPTLNLGLMGRQDWYTKTKDSYWRSPQGMQRSAQLTSGFRAPSRAIDEIGKQLAALSDTYAKPAPSAQPATPTTTQAPSWLSGLQSDVNKAVATKPSEPTRDYRDVAREAQRAVEEKRVKEEQMAQRFASKPSPQPTSIPSSETPISKPSTSYETEEDKRQAIQDAIERERMMARQEKETPFKERVRQPKLLGSLDTPFDVQRRERMARDEMMRERDANRQKAEEEGRKREEYRAWRIKQQMEQ